MSVARACMHVSLGSLRGPIRLRAAWVAVRPLLHPPVSACLLLCSSATATARGSCILCADCWFGGTAYVPLVWYRVLAAASHKVRQQPRPACLAAPSPLPPARSSDLKKAMLAVPRDTFVPRRYAHEALIDMPIRVEEVGFNISAPHMHAAALEALKLQPGQR